jgi:hypothetical protein
MSENCWASDPDVADAIGIALTGGRRLQGVAP